MKFVITLNDGQTIEPIYDPVHALTLFEFYNNLFSRGEIVSWQVVYGQGVDA